MEESDNIEIAVEDLVLTMGYFFMRGFNVSQVDDSLIEDTITLLKMELELRRGTLH